MKKTLLTLFCLIAIFFAANAETTYTHTFKNGELSAEGGTVTLSDIDWSASAATEISWNNTKGIQFGSKSYPTTAYTLSTSGFAGCTIKSITVNTSIAASGDAIMTITVGSQTSEAYKATTTATAYTFDCDDTTGDITIKWTATQRAYYVKSITIEYTPDASMVTVPAPVFATQPGIYADEILVTTNVEYADQSSVFYYTTDGTEPSYEEYLNEGGSTKSSRTYQVYEKLTTTTTIKAMAVIVDGDEIFESDIVEATYVVSPTMPYLPAIEIASGNKYAMVAADSAACGLYGNDANGSLPTKTATAANDRYIETVACAGFTFTATNGGYTIQDEFGRYINPSNTEGELSFTTTQPAAWSIKTDNDGNATITSNGRAIYYSVSNATFGSYSSKSEDNLLPKLYKQREYPEFTISPEAGSQFDKLEKITVSCTEGIAPKDLVVKIEGYEISIAMECKQINENTLEFTLTSPLTTLNNTNLQINITGDIILNPEGMGMPLPVNSRYGIRTLVSYTLMGNAPAATITEVSPANGSVVEELSHFIFTFSYYADHNSYAALQPKLYAEGKTWTYALEKTTSKSDGGNINMDQAALKTTEPLLGNGTYYLEIPTGYFTDGNGKAIEGVTLKYTVKNDSGLLAEIEDVVAESEGGYTVYNLLGVKVLETEDAKQIKTLPTGIYIVNGIKIYIK